MKRTVNFFLLASSILLANSLPIEEVVNYEFLNVKVASQKLFEGDILINPDQEKSLFYPSKSGLINEKYRWQDNTVPYKIATEFDSSRKTKIQEAISKIMSVTCLKLVPFDPLVHKDCITFRPSKSGCSSSVGRQGGEQFINLNPSGCFNGVYTIVHELLHAFGFYHMQSSSERDDYVKILFENVSKGSEHNFKKYLVSVVSNLGTTYDYDSVMHYPAGAFALEYGLSTIEAIKPLKPGVVMGQRNKLSKGDIERVNAMYKCKK